MPTADAFGFHETHGARLAHISAVLDVPIIVITFCAPSSPYKHFDFGVDPNIDQSAFASALHAQCMRGTAIIPNIAVHPDLSKYSDILAKRDLRSMTGVPLSGIDGRHVGSISVVAAYTGGAVRAVSIERLKTLGQAFITQIG